MRGMENLTAGLARFARTLNSVGRKGGRGEQQREREREGEESGRERGREREERREGEGGRGERQGKEMEGE